MLHQPCQLSFEVFLLVSARYSRVDRRTALFGQRHRLDEDRPGGQLLRGHRQNPGPEPAIRRLVNLGPVALPILLASCDRVYMVLNNHYKVSKTKAVTNPPIVSQS